MLINNTDGLIIITVWSLKCIKLPIELFLLTKKIINYYSSVVEQIVESLMAYGDEACCYKKVHEDHLLDS